MATINTSTAAPKVDHEILFQTFFKSDGARTYAAQVKQARNGKPFLVLTEGKRNPKTDEVRKSRLFVFGEHFPAFFKMLHETAQFIRSQPPIAPAPQQKPARSSRPSPAAAKTVRKPLSK